MSLFVRSVNTLIYLFIEILALLLWNYIKPRLFISKSEHRYFVLALEQKVIFFSCSEDSVKKKIPPYHLVEGTRWSR